MPRPFATILLLMALVTAGIPGLRAAEPTAPAASPSTPASAAPRRLLYVAAPGIRNYLEFGGSGLLVFDIDKNYAFVKRIPTSASLEKIPANIKGVCASAATGKLYFTTPAKLYCVDLLTEKTLWDKALPKGCDRMSITPDGATLYVPSFEREIWNVIDGATGDVKATVTTNSGAHNTVVSRDGKRMYLGGLKSSTLFVADTTTHQIVSEVQGLSGAVRPFTVNADQTLAFVCVNGLLGFEVADLKAAKMIHRVAVQGVKMGPVKRHGCPSHGVGLTPDEAEAWVCDGANNMVHVFDIASMPPKQLASVKLREQPGWITFTLDGKHALPSTGEIIDVKTRKIVATLADEAGREVHSEKMIEIHVDSQGKPVLASDQFGLGRKAQP